MEMATCMMESKNLLQIFSAEAIKCAPYIQNRVPHKHVDGITHSNLGVGTSMICLISGFLSLKFGLEFHQKRGGIWNPKVKSAYLLGILNIPKGI